MALTYPHQVEIISTLSPTPVINITIPNLPTSYILLWFKAGNVFDKPHQLGLAHLFEHLYLSQTKKYPDPLSRLQALDKAGIYFNAQINQETAVYYHIQTQAQTLVSLELLLAAAQNSIIDEQLIENEKKIIRAEEKENANNPAKLIWRLNQKSLYPTSPWGNNPSGLPKIWKNINLRDALNFQKKYYTQTNAALVIVGDIATKSLTKQIKKSFQLPLGGKITTPKNLGRLKKLLIKNQKLNQVTIGINFRTTPINNHWERVALDFLKDYLANKWLSCLIERLRIDNNLTYWVDGVTYNYSPTGQLSLVFSVEPKNIKKALVLSFAEIKKLSTTPLADATLIDHKKSFIASLARQFIDPFEIGWFYGWQVGLGAKILTIDEYLDILNQLTSQTLKLTAAKYLEVDKASLTAIGPVKPADFNNLIK